MEQFACGHPKSAQNTRQHGTKTRCRKCHDASMHRSYVKRKNRMRDLETENAQLREQLQAVTGRTA
jgi:CRISPR/Cas system CSM-associated protein Csm2 small subunit